jgi:hypothetical protein
MRSARHSCQYQPLPHAAAQPKRIEDFVEALPIGISRAEQRSERRLEQCRLDGGGRREDGQCVAGFSEADAKAVVS